jgi:hypothetical protein
MRKIISLPEKYAEEINNWLTAGNFCRAVGKFCLACFNRASGKESGTGEIFLNTPK